MPPNIFKSFFDWYLGIIQIDPITLRTREELEIYLTTYCKIKNTRLPISFGFDGYLSSGYFCHLGNRTILIAYERRFLKSTWYFRGKIQENDSGCKLIGCYKSFFPFELMSLLFLAVMTCAVAFFIYMLISGYVFSFFDFFVVFVGFPVTLLIVRAVFAPLPSIGRNSISQIRTLLDNFKQHSKDNAS